MALCFQSKMFHIQACLVFKNIVSQFSPHVKTNTQFEHLPGSIPRPLSMPLAKAPEQITK